MISKSLNSTTMKKIKSLIYGFLAVVVTTACDKDLLNIPNPNEPTTETFWQTEDDAQKGLNAAYSRLYKEGNWLRWLSYRYDLISDEGWSTGPWTELDSGTDRKCVWEDIR